MTIVGRKFCTAGTKIVAAAMNYASAPAVQRTAPVIFLKPTSSCIQEGGVIQLPPECESIHYEVELGCIIGRRGKSILKEEVNNYVCGYFLGLDMTWFEQINFTKFQPWCLGKCFDTACPVSRFITKEEVADPDQVNLWLEINGEMKHQCNTKNMIHKIPDLVSYVSQYMTLEEGDLVLTGAAGTGLCYQNDTITCGMDKIIQMSFNVVK